jgi:membrane protease YdiL (CAAX protease family)
VTVVVMAAVALAGVIEIWLAQTVALWAIGDPRPVAWPFRHPSSSRLVRWVQKLAVQVALFGLLITIPFAAGDRPLAYYRARLWPAQWEQFIRMMAGTMAVLGVMLAIHLACHWIRLTARHGPGKTLLKLIRGSLTPVPLAFVEEAVFRGVILEQLLRALPQTSVGVGLAVVLSAIVFASAHFIRPQRPATLPGLGFFVIGLALGSAYIAAGHTLWVPAAMHAAGIWYTQVLRPFVHFQGPPWLIGNRSYPMFGVLGLGCIALITTWVVMSPTLRDQSPPRTQVGVQSPKPSGGAMPRDAQTDARRPAGTL